MVKKEVLKYRAKLLHEEFRQLGQKSSIARCHEIVAKRLGYNSYNHYLQELKK